MSKASAVFIPKPNAIESLFGRRKVVIGVIHALSLPGSARYDGEPVERIYAHAVAETLPYRENGVNGLIVENHGDIPFVKPDEIGPETSAVMAVMTERVRAAVGGPVGINVLANAPLPALAVPAPAILVVAQHDRLFQSVTRHKGSAPYRGHE